MWDPKPGAHKRHHDLTTFSLRLEGKTLLGVEDRGKEFLPQMSHVAEEHFQTFNFIFLKKSFPGFSTADGKERGKREVRINPQTNSFFISLAWMGVLCLGDHGDKPEGVQHLFLGGAISHFLGTARPVPCPTRDPKEFPWGQGSKTGVSIPPCPWKCHSFPKNPPKTSQRRDFGVSGVFLLFFKFFFPPRWRLGRKSGLRSRAQSGA